MNFKLYQNFALKIKDLEKKDEAEEEAKLQLRAQAKQELDDWYKQHAEQVFIEKLTLYHTGSHQKGYKCQLLKTLNI